MILIIIPKKFLQKPIPPTYSKLSLNHKNKYFIYDF